jgi:hypothetical protein
LNDARYNLAYAQTMLKKQAPPPPPKKQEEKKDSDKKDSDKKDSDKQQDQAQQAPSSKLSKEQADELLNALQREEKKVREKKEKQKGHPVSPEKDW